MDTIILAAIAVSITLISPIILIAIMHRSPQGCESDEYGFRTCDSCQDCETCKGAE